MNNRAFLVVDLQNEYLPTGQLPLVGLQEVVANAARIIAAARERGDLIVHIRHEKPTANARAFIPGSVGAQIIQEVAPIEGEQIVVKNYPNSFRDTNLQDLLVEKSIREVVVLGAMSHMCVEATARAAADHGYLTVVVHDACATMDLEFDGTKVPAHQVHATATVSYTHLTLLTILLV